jgi:long-chain acyl-CoA synthetase
MFHDSKRGAAGRPRPGIRLKIIDADTGEEQPRGEPGLVAVLSPQSTATSPDQWVRTNDIGRMDDDDFLWVLGRADDAINRGGFKIVPQAVEAILRTHPSVIEAAVTGLPDRRLGQIPVAAVMVRDDLSAEDLTAWARDHLPKYQVPAQVLIVDELPRTTSMKVSKDGVRALFAP